MNKGVDDIIANKQIKRLREQKGISQEVAADRISVSRPYYALVESGRREPTLSQLYKLADMLNVKLADITSGAPSEALPVDYRKFKDVILSCIRLGADDDGKITKTKLAKLVYFSDFTWFYDNKKSMTNAMYRCIPRGPVADDYFRAIDDLYEEQTITIEPKGKALLISSIEDVRSKTLSEDEINLIEKICTKWKGHSTEEIVDFTHGQSPWKNSIQSAFIPYETILAEPVTNLY